MCFLIVNSVGCGVHMRRFEMSDLTRNRQNDAAEIRKIDRLRRSSSWLILGKQPVVRRDDCRDDCRDDLLNHPVVERGDLGDRLSPNRGRRGVELGGLKPAKISGPLSCREVEGSVIDFRLEKGACRFGSR
jgi:hypothetical protein